MGEYRAANPESCILVEEYILKNTRRPAILLLNVLIILACRLAPIHTIALSSPSAENTPIPTSNPDFIAQFVNADFVDLEKIQQISLFRSAEGHDYGDDVESCRSMKHYYRPYEDIDWSTIKIYSPVDGDAAAMNEEWAGVQIHIRSRQYPNFIFIIFHVNPDPQMAVGYPVTAGMEMGTHIGNMTYLDIAVAKQDAGGYQLVSYFDVMTDALFRNYMDRGVRSRSDLIISREQRDAGPLFCDGQEFSGQGNLPNWFILA
jgi:hypothetical protein